MCEYLLKPFYKEEMIQTMEKLCRKIRQSRRQRDGRIPELAEKLFALQSEENMQAITACQVQEVTLASGCEDVLREAYTYLIAHQESQPLRAFTALRRTYASETELLENVAQGLTAMLASHGQYRAFVNTMCRARMERAMPISCVIRAHIAPNLDENSQEIAAIMDYLALEGNSSPIMKPDIVAHADITTLWNEYADQVRYGLVDDLLAHAEAFMAEANEIITKSLEK